jgi:hypothetical protein
MHSSLIHCRAPAVLQGCTATARLMASWPCLQLLSSCSRSAHLSKAGSCVAAAARLQLALALLPSHAAPLFTPALDCVAANRWAPEGTKQQGAAAPTQAPLKGCQLTQPICIPDLVNLTVCTCQEAVPPVMQLLLSPAVHFQH